MRSPIALGIDIGGSHITAALVNIDTRTLIMESIHRKMVNSQDLAHNIFDAWCEVINDAYKGYETETKYIGIAMPGPFDYENGICLIKEQDKFQALYQLNLKEELASRLNIPATNIYFINDAASFLQGEVFAGGANDTNNVLGFTLGTGLGSSICTNGKAIDAELWNAPFLNGIAEDYFSTRWFVKRYFQLSGRALEGVKDLADFVNIDIHAKQVFKEFGNNFAQFMMPLIKKHHAEVVIIGGNIAQAFNVFSTNVIDILEHNQFKTKIKISKLKEHAALIGAASCCHMIY
ncbi:ROK family protein [Pedobacter insulae]|uniref:Glucokinase n=1 Tax=Pedobacter insulae TaxID=414048 RepID=A0A1I2ZNC6_9SPHI|nr:ROK family protein [Pedobacter insulae]SFH39019.1 glucokinase [Pedobacter insulae]